MICIQFAHQHWFRGFVGTAILSMCCSGLRAQSTSPNPAQNSHSTLSTPSMGPTAVATTNPTRSPIIVRKDLTESERQAPLDFSVPLRMRNFAELQERIAKGEIISTKEMDAKYFPNTADYQTVVDWLVAQGFGVEPQAKCNLRVFAHGSIAQVELAFGTKFGRVKFEENETSSALIPPSLRAALAERVLGVNGLQPHLRPKPHSKLIVGQAHKLIDNAPPYTVPEISN